MKKKIKNFLAWIWHECKDRRTILLLLLVMAVMYTPMWGGYLLHAIFGWEWGSVVASAYLLFWAGPFTPFLPICIAITLSLKRFFEKRESRKESRKKEEAVQQKTPRDTR